MNIPTDQQQQMSINMDTWIFRENSLDMIRLLAATQVAVLHTFEFIMPSGHTEGIFFQLLRLFPGVPIFFFVSGYLISKSYEKNPSISAYSKNRILRLYPALIVCVAVNLIMVWSTGYFQTTGTDSKDIAALFLTKSTFLQFWNPDFMRSFGDGVLNGSLWTITVELQFYFILPLFYTLFGKNRQISNTTLLVLISLFLFANRMLFYWQSELSNEVVWKLYRVSFAPWFYMFLTGVLFQRNFELISKYLIKVPTLAMIFAYIVLSIILTDNGFSTGNAVSPFLFVVIAPLVFRIAYFMPAKINAVMKGNDISYGIYIWHMPIVNQMIYLGFNEHPWQIAVSILISVMLAVLSWLLIEKPALKLKDFTLNETLKKYNK